MQFFSRYSYIWKFPKEQELAYNRFVQSSNLISLRLVTFITLFGMTVFLIIDYFRDVDFGIVLVSRIFVLTAASVIMVLSYQKWVGNRMIQWGIVCIALMNFSSAMVTANFARMPPYYITNLLFLILVLVTTASGLNFRSGLALNFACLMTFFLFSIFIKRDPFYFSQYPHLIVSFLYIQIVGIVLENRRRVNFMQFTDLVEQKRIVENLNQQKNKIISILSHDLGTPMNALSILLHLQSTGNIKEEELKPFLNDVGSQLDSITSLLQNLVRWSRSQMEGFVPDKKLVDLSNYLHEGAKLFRRASSEKNLNIVLNAETPLMVYADEEMLRMVIRNLISNAVKFGESGTEIKIDGYTKDGNLMVIKIENRGVPIPKHLHDKLFTYQMPSSEDTSGAKGTGLGLAVAAYFVRINQGKIYLQPSADERITIFYIEIPIASKQTQLNQIPLVTSNFSK
ncbi:MAG TPA: HAMP domain-containing sensor histidine kinase [Cyclobacteriaceae bacterium]|nr:HAMP domain-containing sensor histidine kinase [Cyclobacteriaceae bacterium]